MHSKQIVREIFNENVQNLDDIKYKPIDYFDIFQDQKSLHENEVLLFFNKKRHKPNENVHCTLYRYNEKLFRLLN